MDPATSAFEPLQIYVQAAGLGIARMIGVMTVMPAFTRLALTGLLRGAVALLLSLPLLPIIVEALRRHPQTPGSVTLLLVKEAALGVLVGLVVGAPIWAAQFAGDILHTQRGATSGQLTDPSSVEATETGTLLILTTLALFFGSGGLRLTLEAVYQSYQVWPIDRFTPLFSHEAGLLMLGLLDQIVRVGFQMTGPLIMILFLIDLVFGMVARAASQLQPYYLSQSVKNLAFTFLIIVYLSFLVGYAGGELGKILATRARLEAIANPAPR